MTIPATQTREVHQAQGNEAGGDSGLTSPWPEMTLAQVCTRITDGAHASPPSVQEGLPMASVKDLTPHGINMASCRRISVEDFAKLVRQGCQPQSGDVLVAKDGATALSM